MIYLKTITDKMYKIAGTIFNNLDGDYYLAGGTALSLLNYKKGRQNFCYRILSSTINKLF